jgi:hypothetical protein
MATIAADPRFRLARALLSGQCDSWDIDDGGGAVAVVDGGKSSTSPSPQDEAIEIFAALLGESRAAFGDASPDAALCQFEYGNALFRAAVRRRPLLPSKEEEEEEENNEGRRGDGDDDDRKPAAAAALKKGDDGCRRRGEVAAAAALKRSAAFSSTAAGDDDGDDSNRRSSSNKRLKATTDDGEARGEGRWYGRS